MSCRRFHVSCTGRRGCRQLLLRCGWRSGSVCLPSRTMRSGDCSRPCSGRTSCVAGRHRLGHSPMLATSYGIGVYKGIAAPPFPVRGDSRPPCLPVCRRSCYSVDPRGDGQGDGRRVPFCRRGAGRRSWDRWQAGGDSGAGEVLAGPHGRVPRPAAPLASTPPPKTAASSMLLPQVLEGSNDCRLLQAQPLLG